MVPEPIPPPIPPLIAPKVDVFAPNYIPPAEPILPPIPGGFTPPGGWPNIDEGALPGAVEPKGAPPAEEAAPKAIPP
jgi:hypothetical protein